MRTYKEQIRKVTDDVICDCCGQSTTTINMGPSWAELNATWGYGCINDGMQYNIDLCESCFTDVIDFVKNSRRKILGPFKYPHEHDPLNGKFYL